MTSKRTKPTLVSTSQNSSEVAVHESDYQLPLSQ